MERMKTNKIIAVSTSLGTNFLISACNDATFSDLKGLIQIGHLSCFPEHGSINIMALTVQYSQKQYHVTDSLLVGQIFRKSWNKIHAEVSSGSLRAAVTSNGSKSAEVESLANGKAGNPCAIPGDTVLVKCPGSEGLVVDRDRNGACAHSSSPLLCTEKAAQHCNKMIPAVSDSQDSWINCGKFRCPLLSMEAPYTQSYSQLNLATRPAVGNKVLDKVSECRKRKCAEEEEILARKRHQAEVAGQIIHNSDRNKELSPDNRCTSSIERDLNTQEHICSLLRGQKCNQGFIEEVLPVKGDAQLAEAYKKPQRNESQPDNFISTNTSMADDSILKETSKDLPPNSEGFVVSPQQLKLTSTVCEELDKFTEEVSSGQANVNTLKELATLEKQLVKEDHSCPKLSTQNREEGFEEDTLNNGARLSEVDLSMGYPIQLNDHTILLVASLSADIVPETQESEMQSQDGMNAESEEAVLAQRGLDVDEHAAMERHSNCLRQDLVEPEKIGSEGTRDVNSMELNNDVGNLAIPAEEMETPNPKLFEVGDRPSKSPSPDKTNAVAETEILDEQNRQLHDTSVSGGNHGIPSLQKKKKRRRKKLCEINKVSVQEDSRFVNSGSKSQDIQGDIVPKREEEKTAQLTETPIQTCNREKGAESCHMQEKQALTELGNFYADHSEMQSQNGTALNLDEGNINLKQSSPFPCENSVELREVLINSSLRNESEEKCIKGCLKGGCEPAQGELLCMKQGALTQLEPTRRKKKKRRKEPPLPGPEVALGDHLLDLDNEGDCAPFSIKDLPNALKLAALKEGELNWNKKAEVFDEQVMKKESKRKKKETTETDPNISLMQEQGQENADRNDTEFLLKEGLVTSSFTSPPSKECSQEGLMVKTKRGFDVFDFESSETVNRQKETCVDNEVASDSEANNLEKICSAAVKLVEDDILNASKMTTRKLSRKAVHPKRWITVLSERLTWNQMSKNNSKKQRANKKSKRVAEGTHLPNDEDFNPEPLYVEGEEAKEESSQIIVNVGRVACPAGCGRLYTKKTSAYYRHFKKCPGW